MKKMVYVVTEYCLAQSGDDFDLYHTFDLDDARCALTDEADTGYRLNKKNPKKVSYIIFGYEVDTDEIDEDESCDINDAKSLFCAYASSQCCLVHVFDEPYVIPQKKDGDDDDDN